MKCLLVAIWEDGRQTKDFETSREDEGRGRKPVNLNGGGLGMALFAAAKDWDYGQNAILDPGEMLIDKIAYRRSGSKSLHFQPTLPPSSAVVTSSPNGFLRWESGKQNHLQSASERSHTQYHLQSFSKGSIVVANVH